LVAPAHKVHRKAERACKQKRELGVWRKPNPSCSPQTFLTSTEKATTEKHEKGGQKDRHGPHMGGPTREKKLGDPVYKLDPEQQKMPRQRDASEGVRDSWAMKQAKFWAQPGQAKKKKVVFPKQRRKKVPWGKGKSTEALQQKRVQTEPRLWVGTTEEVETGEGGEGEKFCHRRTTHAVSGRRGGGKRSGPAATERKRTGERQKWFGQT